MFLQNFNFSTRGQVLETAELFDISPDSEIPPELVLPIILYVKLGDYVTCNVENQILKHLDLWKTFDRNVIQCIAEHRPIIPVISVINFPGNLLILPGGYPVDMEGNIVVFNDYPEFTQTVYVSQIYNNMLERTRNEPD